MMPTATAVVRTPQELAPLIKAQIEFGDIAAEEAGMPHYRRAGGMLIEAKPGVRIDGRETFVDYCERVTQKSYSQCRRYMVAFQEQRRVARITSTRRNGENVLARTSPSLRAATGASQVGQGAPAASHLMARREWTAPVDDAVRIAREQQSRAAEDRATEQRRKQELARKLIQIGYRVLAQELHPDRMGGSRDAMTRLNEVRGRLNDVYG